MQANEPKSNELANWSLLNGPNTPTIENISNPLTDVSNLVAGKYLFRWTIQKASCESFNDVQIIIQKALPVTFNSFTGTLHNKSVSLQWSTAAELNNDIFSRKKFRRCYF